MAYFKMLLSRLPLQHQNFKQVLTDLLFCTQHVKGGRKLDLKAPKDTHTIDVLFLREEHMKIMQQKYLKNWNCISTMHSAIKWYVFLNICIFNTIQGTSFHLNEIRMFLKLSIFFSTDLPTQISLLRDKIS